MPTFSLRGTAIGTSLAGMGVGTGFAAAASSQSESKYIQAKDDLIKELQRENRQITNTILNQTKTIKRLESDGERILNNVDLFSLKHRSPHYCPWGDVGTRYKYKNNSMAFQFNGKTRYLDFQEWGCPKS